MRTNRWYAKRRRKQKSTYCAQQPTPPIEAYDPGCQTIHEQDEYCCPCGLRWGVDEERPPCLRAR